MAETSSASFGKGPRSSLRKDRPWWEDINCAREGGEWVSWERRREETETEEERETNAFSQSNVDLKLRRG